MATITVSFDCPGGDNDTMADVVVTPPDDRRIIPAGGSEDFELNPGPHAVSANIRAPEDADWTLTVDPSHGSTQKRTGTGAGITNLMVVAS